MLKVYFLAAVAALCLLGAAAAGAAPLTPGLAARPASDATIFAASAIPPNCTMNPWTGRYTCHANPPSRVLTVMR